MFSLDYDGGKTARSSVSRVMRDDLTDGELAVLGRSEEVRIRAAVAARPLTPLTMLLVLANDEAPSVRAGVARNPRRDIPLEVREALAQDKNPEVLFALIACECVPERIISRLSRSWNRDVAAEAKDRARSRKESGASAPATGQVGFASS
jgi:hypothetical protein